MNIVHLTPGAGGMYCGNCFRDNALVGALRRLGHAPVMVPLYLPMTLDEEDQSAGTPVFFGGINLYLQQQFPLYRHVPRWLRKLLDRPTLLRWAGSRAAKTQASQVGALTLSMLRGEAGNQVAELEELVAWLKSSVQPDLICLSNALLVGMVRRFKHAFGVPVVCFLQGEDGFLDGLPDNYRHEAWSTLSQRATEVDLFVAPSHYFAGLMRTRLGLPPAQVTVIYNGLNLDGFAPAAQPPHPPVLGYFARMCREKGLDTLVDAFLILRSRPAHSSLRLHVGGSCGPGDRPFVQALVQKLARGGLSGQFQFFPNLDRGSKLRFYQSLSVCSVPARYGEAFGLYVLEALASGVPVVQPRAAAFPELVEATGGGILCEAEDPRSLADAVGSLLLDPARARAHGQAGRRAVLQEFGIERMAQNLVAVFAGMARARGSAAFPEEARPSAL